MKLVLSVAAFLLFAAYAQTLATAEESEYHDIIVIGAGIAGIAAANQLNENGYDVIVLEARDRIGGRILTDNSYDGYYLDVGASWIHGIKNNPIEALAEKYDVERTQFDNFTSFVLYDKEGDLVYSSEKEDFYYNEEDEDEPICDGATGNLERYCAIFERFDAFKDFYRNERENIRANNGEDISLNTALEQFIQQENLTEDELIELHFALVWWIEGDYGADASEISLLSFEDMGYVMEGMEVIFPKGYVQIIDGLADGLDIRLEHVVTEVDYNDDIIHIRTDKGDFDAKYVISTLPLGVLQKNSVDFNPDLPEKKTVSINNLKMGILNKVYYVFDEVFWNKEHDWIAHMSTEKGHWAYFANLYSVLGKPALLAFNTANFGRDLETMTEEDIVNEGFSVLKKIYGDKIPEPVFTKVTKWGSDDLSFGSYSYTAVGSTNYDFYELSKPIDNKVFFAGEATEVNYPATVHGAFFSGVREANRIQWLEGNQLSLTTQLGNWILPTYVICKEGLQLYYTDEGETSICIKENTKEILEQRGWIFESHPYEY